MTIRPLYSTFFLIVLLSCVGGFSFRAAADTVNSSQFSIDIPTAGLGTRDTTTSPSFSLTSSLSSIVGTATSASFVVNNAQVEVSTTPTPPPPPPSGGGGGGGGGVPPQPPRPPSINVTLSNDLTCPIYRSSVILVGTKDAVVDAVEINGSSSSVNYPTTTSWSGPLSLLVGDNKFTLQGLSGTFRGPITSYTAIRHKPGDINGDGRVDDFDLSIVASHWNKNYCPADFNRDGKVDDFDLSILVSGWGK